MTNFVPPRRGTTVSFSGTIAFTTSSLIESREILRNLLPFKRFSAPTNLLRSQSILNTENMDIRGGEIKFRVPRGGNRRRSTGAHNYPVLLLRLLGREGESRSKYKELKGRDAVDERTELNPFWNPSP